MKLLRHALIASAAALLAACAMPDAPREAGPRLTAAEARARVASLIPRSVPDRAGWATDIYAAMAALEIRPSVENICAVVAITDQESGFKVHPVVPNLAAIASKEIDRQRERAGVPKLVLDAALALPSSDGRSYRERLEGARTEHELSEIFDDFAGRVPLGRRFLEDRNPVRTGGPMQVSIAFAKAHAAARPYPYADAASVRQEVFTRRGGLYYGIAHLLDYPAAYERPLHRFADFNAGHYASRNAAFQKALTDVTGIPLELDGDLVRHDAPKDAPGATETAARVLGRRIDMDAGEVRRDLERGREHDFERTRLYRKVFELADAPGKRAERAVVPRIRLESPKIRRKLTTQWFATRVDERYRSCIARADNPDGQRHRS